MNKSQLEILKRQAIQHDDQELLWLVEQAEKIKRIENHIEGKWGTEKVSVYLLHELLKTE